MRSDDNFTGVEMSFIPENGQILGSMDIDPVNQWPSVSQLIALVDKVCALPEREEKWMLLKALTELLVLASYPPMIMRPENAKTDNHQA